MKRKVMSVNNWITCKISDICCSISDTYKRTDEYVVLVNTSDILEGKILNHKPTENKNLKGQFKKTFKKNDILYSEIRPANKRFAFVDIENTDNYIASTKLMVLRCDETKILPKFLFFVLKSSYIIGQLQLLAETRSGTFPQITFSGELGPMEINLPDFETQHKIVSIIGSLEDKIQLNNKINCNLEKQVQAIYTSMFIQNRKSEWKLGQLSELIAVRYGKDHKKLNDGNYPVYGSGGIMRYGERPLYSGESVLIPRKGTLNNVMYVNESFWSVDTMFYTEMLFPNVAKYVYHFLKGIDLGSLNAGSAVPSMTTNILNAMQLYIPDNYTLQKFEEAVQPMYDIMQENRKQSAVLANVRDTLLPRLMNGEIDVSQVEI